MLVAPFFKEIDMNCIETYMAKLQAVINDFDAIIEQAVIDTKAEVITLNQTQLLHGFGSDDKRLGTYRNPEYKKQKMTMNPLAGGFVDLKLTGSFHRLFYVELKNKSILVKSSDSKWEELQLKYGDNIFGLNTDNKKIYGKTVNKRLNEIIKQKLK